MPTIGEQVCVTLRSNKQAIGKYIGKGKQTVKVNGKMDRKPHDVYLLEIDGATAAFDTADVVRIGEPDGCDACATGGRRA